MHPIHDSDIQLMLALTLAAKRKPASLVEIVAAMDLLFGSIASEVKLSAAFHRLGAQGLVSASDDAFTLTADAQKMMSAQPRRAATAEHIASLKEKLADHSAAGGAPIHIGTEQIATAIHTHHISAQGAKKNLLMPVRSKETDNKRAAPRRRPAPRTRG